MSGELNGKPATDPRLKVILDQVGQDLDRRLNPGSGDRRVGFLVMIFPLGVPPPSQCSYVTNADVPDVAALLADQAEELKPKGKRR